LGSGIRKKLFRIPDPGVKKAPDPGSATLIFFQNIQGEEECRMPRRRRGGGGVLLDVTALLLVLVPGVGGLEVDGLAAARPLHVSASLTAHSAPRHTAVTIRGWRCEKFSFIGFSDPGLRIRIHFIRNRIQHFRLNTDPNPDPIRIRIQSGSRAFMTLLDQKLQFTYP
jgi:hypothetical protein